MADAPPAPESAAPAVSESADGKRRSRWGAKTEDAAASSEAPAAARKRSRWGSKPAQTADPVTLAVQLGIPLATLQQMTAEQQQMLPVIKSKIDEIDLQCAACPCHTLHASVALQLDCLLCCLRCCNCPRCCC